MGVHLLYSCIIIVGAHLLYSCIIIVGAHLLYSCIIIVGAHLLYSCIIIVLAFLEREDRNKCDRSINLNWKLPVILNNLFLI